MGVYTIMHAINDKALEPHTEYALVHVHPRIEHPRVSHSLIEKPLVLRHSLIKHPLMLLQKHEAYGDIYDMHRHQQHCHVIEIMQHFIQLNFDTLNVTLCFIITAH